MKTRAEKIEEFLRTLNIDNVDLNYCVDANEVEDFDSITDMLIDNGAFDVEIIYYSEAIKYLMEHDPSLRNSLEIASEFGFEIDSLNSETLASLLASQNAREQWHELESEVTEFLETL